RPWIERAVRECIGAGAFFETGTEILIHDHAIRDPRFRDAAGAAAAAFAGFRSHLEGTLAPAAHEDCGCGGEAFDLLLRRGHFLEIDAAAVRAAAQEEIARCEAALAAGAEEFGTRTWREALAQLTGRHPAAERYYARYAEVWEEMRRAAVAQAAPSLYFLAYRSPAPYDRLPTVDYLVPPVDPEMPPDEQARRLRATNDSVIKLNHVIHHGGIGHHVQNWHAQRAASRIGQVAAVDCAGRIALFCGGTMAEGWACYATDLMEEIGVLTPLERYAQIHARLRMAVRALVDVELHHGALTVDAAAAVYQERAGLAPEAARAEAVKNSMFPGTAMMYSAGRNLIHGLRRDLAAAHPGRFDLRGFHDRLLAHGSVPVALIGAAMRTAYARV
ncbi:MAG: DUF885 domain-containing protein, partial [Bacillati bacterium ANGP1]